ncbi:hypothetical protein SFC17_03070 [Bacillus paralicheniformis]|nr:hypothetical protein [Bacillus paralicheniformis]
MKHRAAPESMPFLIEQLKKPATVRNEMKYPTAFRLPKTLF